MYHSLTAAAVTLTALAPVTTTPAAVVPHKVLSSVLSPNGIALDPITGVLFVAQGTASGSVAAINATTGQHVATITTGADTYGIVFDPTNSTIYATNLAANTVSVINANTYQLIKNIQVQQSPFGIAVDPVTNTIYVTNQLGSGKRHTGSVSVISGATNKVVATIPVASTPEGVATYPAIHRAYVVNSGLDVALSATGTVSVIDTQANKVIATVPVGLTPDGIAVDPATKHVFVANKYDTTHPISVLSTATNAVVGTVMVTNTPRALVLLPSSHTVVAAGSSLIARIDTKTLTVISTNSAHETFIPNMWAVTANVTTSAVYVADAANNTILRF